jgi:hypothetical protein
MRQQFSHLHVGERDDRMRENAPMGDEGHEIGAQQRGRRRIERRRAIEVFIEGRKNAPGGVAPHPDRHAVEAVRRSADVHLVQGGDDGLARTNARAPDARLDRSPPGKRKHERVVTIPNEFRGSLDKARGRAPLDDPEVRQTENPQSRAERETVGDGHVDAHDAQHQFFAPSVEAVARVERVA